MSHGMDGGSLQKRSIEKILALSDAIINDDQAVVPALIGLRVFHYLTTVTVQDAFL